MGNVAHHMIGNLLTLTAATGVFSLAVVLLQNLLARRVRVPVRVEESVRSCRETGG